MRLITKKDTKSSTELLQQENSSVRNNNVGLKKMGIYGDPKTLDASGSGISPTIADSIIVNDSIEEVNALKRDPKQKG